MIRDVVEPTRAAFERQLLPGVRVVVYTDDAGTEAYFAVVVRVNRASVTIEVGGEKKRVPLSVIADLAPGERSRLQKG